MRKIISLVLACVLCFAAMPVLAFADTKTTNNLFGVITDAEGNVVEVLTMPLATYLNSVYTIPANGSLIKYQYEPTELFTFCVKTYNTNGVTITEPGYDFTAWIESSDTIGGSGRAGFGLSLKDGDPGDKITLIANVEGANDDKYFNSKVTNNSSKPTTLRLIVVLNDDTVPY